RLAAVEGRPHPLPLSARRPDTRCAHRRRSLHRRREGVAMSALVVAQDLRRTYAIRRGLFREPAQLHAVSGISCELEAGKTLAVGGESGCGKSALARLVTLIEKPTSGTLTIDGIDAITPPPDTLPRLRQSVQIVFQDPYGSLNPRKRIGSILEEPLRI